MAKNKSQYDSTLNLPKTLFEMRAGLPKKGTDELSCLYVSQQGIQHAGIG